VCGHCICEGGRYLIDKARKRNKLDILFDILTAGLSMMDLVTDIWVMAEYRVEGHDTFFWLSLATLLMCTVCYTVSFATQVSNNGGDCGSFVIPFLCFLPCGQCYPYIQYFFLSDDFHIGASTEDDPVQAYLMKKAWTHAGFILESMFEAVPMSIIQMVFVLQQREIAPVMVISLMISLISVASKGFMLSFATHKTVFAFNFLCIIHDVFNLFACFAWAFHDPGSVSNVGWTIWLIWLAIEGTVVLFISILYMLHLTEESHSTNDIQYNPHTGRRETLTIGPCDLCCGLITTCIAAPFMTVVLEAFKFSFYPIFIQESTDRQSPRTGKWSVQLFNWIMKGKDKLVRLFYSNKVLLGKLGKAQEFDNAAGKTISRDEIMRFPLKEYSYSQIREWKGTALKDFKARFRRSLEETGSWGRGCYRDLWVKMCFVCGPILALMKLYCVIFPAISLIICDKNDIPWLPVILTSIQLTVMFCGCCLLPWVYAYEVTRSHLIDHDSAVFEHDFEVIQALYWQHEIRGLILGFDLFSEETCKVIVDFIRPEALEIRTVAQERIYGPDRTFLEEILSVV